MKVLVSNYAFNAVSKTVTFSDYSAISLDGVLLITNVTSNVIIYNFASPAKGGTAATNVLTVAYNTATMSNTDRLQIYYDDQQSELFYAKALTANDTITPSSGKRIKIIRAQIMQNPDNTTSTSVKLNFTSRGDFLVGWALSDKPDVIGAINEALNITLVGGAPVSINIRYKEL